MNPASDCAKWQSCRANICPLDPDWSLRRHLDGERICLYLTEAVKPGTESILRGVLPSEVVARINLVIDEINTRQHCLKKALDRAALTGSKMRPPWVRT